MSADHDVDSALISTTRSDSQSRPERLHHDHHEELHARKLLIVILLTAAAGVAMLSGCSSSADTPSSQPTSSATGSATTADCTRKAILKALPGGATMQGFTCADVSGTTWAAARVSPGDTVFFLQWNGSSWNAEDSDNVCGAASAGLPSKLLAYCQPAPTTASPTTPPVTPTKPATPTTPATAACTEKEILAALPGGATMQKFTCADVSGTMWAATRVNPGDTVFFLQWNGSAWKAEDSGSVCGTASAGLPQKLLAYC